MLLFCNCSPLPPILPNQNISTQSSLGYEAARRPTGRDVDTIAPAGKIVRMQAEGSCCVNISGWDRLRL